MRLLYPLALATLLSVAGEVSRVQDWMQQAFYPVLVLVLLVASLGVPIPEDIPLIVAGALLYTHQGVASWEGTILVALVGIMSGDLVLYTLGRRWGPEVVNHRSVRWLITPKRFTRLSQQFRRHGVWMVVVGRFFMGIRAAMCLTAGATHFPYWRFFLADLAGATVSAPAFILLGYWFATQLETLRAYLRGVEGVALTIAIGVVFVLVLGYQMRKRRRAQRITGRRTELARDTTAARISTPAAAQSDTRPPAGITPLKSEVDPPSGA